VKLSHLLNSVRASLRRAGVPSADVDADVLIAHALSVGRAMIYADGDRRLSPSQEAAIRRLARERERRIPLQHIVGECEFMSLRFKVEPGVFIPRPETEVLVEALVGEAAGLGRERLRILDLCTGCGVVGIALATLVPADILVATDISPRAVRVARENALMNGVGHVMRFVIADGLDSFGASRDSGRGAGFDVVACNPPYIPAAAIEGLEPEVRDQEPRMAIDGGADGFRFFDVIVPRVASIMSEGGIAGFEMGEGQGRRLSGMLEGRGFEDVRVIQDLAGRDRVVTGRKA
jgi:release factor glutamine methyltransferase